MKQIIIFYIILVKSDIFITKKIFPLAPISEKGAKSELWAE